MNIEQILKEWADDSVIDQIALDDATIKGARLHSKYLELLVHARGKLKAFNHQLEKLKKDKWLYYTGKMSKQQIDDRGWPYDPFDGASKPLRSDLDYYIKSDDDLQKVLIKIEYQEEMVELLTEIINTLKWRHQAIKNIIEWRKFQAGA